MSEEQQEEKFDQAKYREARRAEIAKEIIREMYGERYVNATLSGLLMPSEDIKKLHKWLSHRKNMFIYQGNPGCGKTYFCAAMINYCYPRFDSCRAWKEDKLMEELRSGINKNHDYSHNLCLMIDDEFVIYDDLGSTGFTNWKSDVVFELIDERYSSMNPTIITTNLTVNELKQQYHERVISRMFAKENTIISAMTEDYRQTEPKS